MKARPVEDYYSLAPYGPSGLWVDVNHLSIRVDRPGCFAEGREVPVSQRDSIRRAMLRRTLAPQVRKKISRSLKGKRKRTRKRPGQRRAVSLLSRAKMAASARTRNFRVASIAGG